MFPVLTPKEEPPANADEALGTIASGLGFGGGFGRGDGLTTPTYVEKVTPYALTNPIWLDIDADGSWSPPGNAPGPAADPRTDACPDEEETEE